MIKSLIKIGLSSVCCFVVNAQNGLDTLNVQHLDEVVVTDTKFKIDKEKSGKVITVINSQMLDDLKGLTVAQIITSVAGIEINGARSYDGQNLNYYVRGGRNRQVVVVIDGVQMTDPSQIANDYDLRLLLTKQIERIEILKGAASTLYGSGAATAVINITTKRISSKDFKINYSAVIGTNKTAEDNDYDARLFQNNAMISGTISGLEYKLGVANRFSDGISAVDGGEDDDFYNSVNTDVEVGYRFKNNSRISAYFRTHRFKTEFDDGFNLIDADNLSTSSQKRLGMMFNFPYEEGTFTINAAYNNIDRQIESDFPTQFKGETYVLDAFNKYTFKDKFHTVLGINAINNGMESFSIPFGENVFQQDIDPSLAEFNIWDPYLNVLYSDAGLSINTGMRLNNHSEYGSHLVYSINPSYLIKSGFGDVKFLASYSTAYITPSLFQLFEPSFGNMELEPEENATLEVGSTITFNKKIEFSIVYFKRQEKNFIDFIDLGEFMFQYKNIEDEFTASGLEFVSTIKLDPKLKLAVNATYTKVDKDLNLRIPEFMGNASLSFSPNDRFSTRLDYHYNADRRDSYINPETFESELVTLNSYNIFDLFVSCELIKNKVNLFANLSNILNEELTEVFGFSTRGRNLNLGLNLDL